MVFTIGAAANGKYDKNNGFQQRYGLELSNGNHNGQKPFVVSYGVGAGYPGAYGKLKLSGEIPFTKTGCHNWITTSGMMIYGEGKAEGNYIKTKNTGTAKDGQHEYRVEGGGGIEFSYRNANFDGAVGVKGWYEHGNIFSLDKELRKKCNLGQAGVGPTLRVQGFIPNTDTGGLQMYGGIGIGASVQYNVLNNQVEGNVSISYSFGE